MGLALVSWTPRDLELRGVVEPGARFSLSSAPGELRWTLSEHGQAEGLAVVNEGTLQLERGEQLELRVHRGATVTEGESVAVIDSVLVTRLITELEAERAEISAQVNLLQAGGRLETIRRAQADVQVAEAQLAAAALASDRLRPADGVIARAEIEDLAAVVAVRERELSFSQAGLAEARLPARPEEVATLVARLSGVESRIAEANRRQAALTVVSPITGSVGAGRDNELLAVVSATERFARFPVPESDRERIHIGDDVDFASPSTEGAMEGQVVDIADVAVPLGTESVFWVAVQLDDAGALPPGATGTARFHPDDS
ncbi:MAG TPA: hypothetical protein QGF58_12990 [Myxococcota bacterium]|nr:hypothetical protein [Myxococcota bacterium]